MTQVQGQRKKQTKQPVEVEERPSFQDLPTRHDIEETHAKREPKRQELQEQQDPHTKKMLRNLEEQEKNATDKVLRESLQWEIKIIKQAIKKFPKIDNIWVSLYNSIFSPRLFTIIENSMGLQYTSELLSRMIGKTCIIEVVKEYEEISQKKARRYTV